MNHIYTLLVFVLLGNSCFNNKKKVFNSKKFDSIESNNIENNKKEKKSHKKISLNEKWLKKVSINISKDVNAISILKKVAQSLGVKINFHIDSLNIQYESNNKSFIDILLDISSASDLKVIISGLNASISKDTEYIHNYYFANLGGVKKTNNTSSIDHNFAEESSNNITKSDYSSSVNFFDEIKKNLEVLLSNEKESRFFINTQSGVITVIAPQRVHKMISKYLISIKKNFSHEILVEAKLIEVLLYDKFEVGIDWSKLGEVVFSGGIKHVLKIDKFLSVPDIKDKKKSISFSNFLSENNFLNIISEFGEVESVSNPRMLISNNDFGMFKSVENKVYFMLESQSQHMGKDERRYNEYTQFSSKQKTYPIGVTFFVHVIKLDNGKIKVYLKPTITDVDNHIEDPAYRLMNGKGEAPKVPIIKTREIETTLTVEENETVVIGGLIYSKSYKKNNGIFNLFSRAFDKFFSNNTLSEKTELVVLLKASSVNIDQNIDVYDFLYEN